MFAVHLALGDLIRRCSGLPKAALLTLAELHLDEEAFLKGRGA
jgi:hypothetical protein